MIKELNHIGLNTGDVEKSIDFYVNILGGTIINDARSADGKGRFVYVQLANGVIELLKNRPDSPNLGFRHLAYEVDEPIGDVHQKLVDLGYEFTVAPKLGASGMEYLAFFKDASGAVFEIIERERKLRIPDLTNPHIKEFHHIGLLVADEDVDTCDAFYLTHMGFSADTVPADAGQDARYYKLNSDRLKAIRVPEKVAVPLAHVAFIVEDCAATKAYLESHGIICGDVHICERCGSRVMKVEGPDKEKLIFAEKI